VVLAGIVLPRRRVTTEPRTERRAAAAPPVPTPTPAFAPAFALAFRWRAVPLALLPQVGAFFMFQAPAAEAPPRREIVAGGSYWRALYDQTLGYEYATDCEGGNNRIPTLASREAETVDGMLGYRFRTAKGDRVTIEARYQAGHDAVSAIDSGPVTTMPRDFDTWAAGGAVMLEQRDLTARLSLMSGAIGSTGRMANGIAPTMMLRFGDEARWFSELQVADRTRFGATGEFSYLGIGYTMGRDRPRAMLGLGEGGRLDVFVPMAGFETGLSYRSLSMREDGSHGGEGWRVSVQRAIRLR
jgi:hypothetical protein